LDDIANFEERKVKIKSQNSIVGVSTLRVVCSR